MALNVNHMLLLYLCTFLSLKRAFTFIVDSNIIAKFATLNNVEIQNIAVNYNADASVSNADVIYIGATNHIFQLDSNLTLLKTLSTGPQMDSPHCNFNGDCLTHSLSMTSNVFHQSNKTMMNNFNKILLIDSDDKTLIVCGSLKQGVCFLYKLENILKGVKLREQVPVAANAHNASTVAVLSRDNRAMYVAASYTYDSYRSNFPAIASRSMELDRFFQLQHHNIDGQSEIVVKAENRFDFRISYIHAFLSQNFVYFALVQPESMRLGATLVSKLARICSSDTSYKSYTEVTLECLGTNNAKFNILKTALVSRLSKNGTDDEYFIGIFYRNTENQKSIINNQRQQSAVCIYPLKDIEQKFFQNVQRCMKGIGEWMIPHFAKQIKCEKINNFGNANAQTCNERSLSGSIPIASVALVTMNESLTSISVDTTQNRSIMFVGTNAGHIKKVF